jgi:hypothetical protein
VRNGDAGRFLSACQHKSVALENHSGFGEFLAKKKAQNLSRGQDSNLRLSGYESEFQCINLNMQQSIL